MNTPSSSAPSSKHVVVFGGGISGLTVAHECIEQGFTVDLYEQTEHMGGKALSFRLADDHAFAGAPVEHSLRAFQATYFALFETMKRIPHSRGGNCFNMLRPLHGLLLTGGLGTRENTAPDRLLDTSTASSPLKRFAGLYKSMRERGVTRREFLSFLGMIADYLTLSPERQRTVIGAKSFAEYARLSQRSEAFRTYLTSLCEISVAAKPTASADVVLDLFARLFTSSLLNVHKVESFVNTTDGPTNECLIDPWVEHLKTLGVQIRTGIGIERALIDTQGRITAARLTDGSQLKADAFVLAIPHRAIRRVAPELDRSTGLASLRDEWSNGFQFFLRDLPTSMANRRTFNMALGSPWRVVFLLEGPPVWSAEVRLPKGVRAVLSVTASQHSMPGALYGKPLAQCTWEEVQQELLHQIGFEERHLIAGAVMDPTLHYICETEYQKASNSVYKDWAVQGINPNNHRWISSTTLCIATPESRQQPFPTRTSVHGLFMAGEFIETVIKTPNMEKACQSGKMCAQAIFQSFGATYPADRLAAPKVPLGWVIRTRDRLTAFL